MAASSARSPPDPVVEPIEPVTGTPVEPPLGDQAPGVGGRLAVRGQQRCQLVVPGVDPAMPGMTFDPGGPGFATGVPPCEDRPLFALQLDQHLARRPHQVVIGGAGEVDVVTLAIVRNPIDVHESVARTVIPLQLDIDALKTVVYQLLLAPDLRHAARLPAAASPLVITIYRWSIRYRMPLVIPQPTTSLQPLRHHKFNLSSPRPALY